MLRLGIIFTVTGAIIFAVLGRQDRLPPWAAIALGSALVIIGLPMVVAGVYPGFGKGNLSDLP